MAFTERYVRSDAAGGGDGTTDTNSGANGAWTFAEMITAAPSAGTRVNVKAGSYSVGAYTLGTGTAAAPFVIRGFNSTIGDLDNQGRNADGSLNTTNFPDITITSKWIPAAFSVLQNLDITGALSTQLVGTGTQDNGAVISCRFVNTQNNASASTFQGDQHWQLINCDFECTGAAHSIVVDMAGTTYVHGCRFKGVSTSDLLDIETGQVSFCTFIGNSGATNKGLVCDVVTSGMPFRVF